MDDKLLKKAAYTALKKELAEIPDENTLATQMQFSSDFEKR